MLLWSVIWRPIRATGGNMEPSNQGIGALLIRITSEAKYYGCWAFMILVFVSGFALVMSNLRDKYDVSDNSKYSIAVVFGLFLAIVIPPITFGYPWQSSDINIATQSEYPHRLQFQ